MKEQHVGSDFDEHLEEEGLLEETEAVAAKRVLAHQIAQAMEEQELSKSAMADHMGTSRSSLDRLLDPEVPSVTLATLQKAARALGKRVGVEMVDVPPDEKTTTDRKREPMGQDAWERFQAGMASRLIERNHALYLRDKNPIHALFAYRVARAFKVEVPEWILSMFDQWGEALWEQRPTEKKAIADALGLGAKGGPSLMFQAKVDGRDLRIAERVFQLRTEDPEHDKLDIFLQVAEEFSRSSDGEKTISSDRVQSIWYELTRGIDTR